MHGCVLGDQERRQIIIPINIACLFCELGIPFHLFSFRMNTISFSFFSFSFYSFYFLISCYLYSSDFTFPLVLEIFTIRA